MFSGCCLLWTVQFRTGPK